MKSYTLEIEIDQPRAKVAELFGDPANLACWQPGLLSSEPVEGKPNQHRLRYENRGQEFEMIETITSDNLPDEFNTRYDAKGMVMTVENRFEECGPDRTRWISENSPEVSGFMMKLFALLVPGYCRKQSYRYMVNFKAFAETGADVREGAGLRPRDQQSVISG